MKLISPALHVLSLILLILAMLMAIPAALSLTGHTAGGFSTNSRGLFIAIGITATSALFLRTAFANRIDHITPRAMLLITAVNWLGVCLFSALPFMLCEPGLSWSDALFESVSGVTTTGSTVFNHLDQMPPEILLWRSITQWIGGLGIIGMAITVLPFLRVGGMRLFQTESSDWSDKATPKTAHWLKAIIITYLVLSLACFIAYMLAGMAPFEAINHAMTTISTGGFSTSDASIGHYPGLAVQWVCIIFMLAGGMPFTVFILAWYRRRFEFLQNQQVHGYLLTLLFFSLGLGIYHWLEHNRGDFLRDFTAATLNMVSVMTTTGFASEDYSRWGFAAYCFFFLLSFVGGCSGSTSGGIKIFRFQILYELTQDQFHRAVHPRAASSLHYNDKKVTADVLASVTAFLFLVVLSFAVLSMALAFCGLDLTTALSGSATALMNVGPGLGDIIGPSGNFSTLPVAAKLSLCAGMLLGRLEYVTILVLFSRVFWRG